MKKYFSLALMCLATLVMFTACEPTDNGNSKEGEWLTNPSQIEGYVPADTASCCWQLDFWCDGTTIGRDYMWAPESAIVYMIKMAMQADYQVHNKYTKKYMYSKVQEPTEDACASCQWEGAKCWLITYTLPNGVTDQEYFWAPEENAKERWEYYKAHLAEVGLVDYSYVEADITDKDACYAMNPEDTTIVTPPDPQEPKDYSKYDSVNYYCWEVTQSAYGMTKTTYHWQTEKVLVMTFDLINIDYTYKKANADDEEACNELNGSEEGEEACWKITVSMYGVTSVSYYWGYEAEAEAQVSGVTSMGGSGSYERTAADDADGCHE